MLQISWATSDVSEDLLYVMLLNSDWQISIDMIPFVFFYNSIIIVVIASRVKQQLQVWPECWSYNAV